MNERINSYEEENKKSTKNGIYNVVVVGIFAIILFVTILYMHDLAYQTNDDVIIRNLISGAYTGSPSVHGIYMIFPLTLVLKWLYMLYGEIDWYAILLIASEMIFYMIVMHKIVKKMNSIQSKSIAMLLSMILITYFFNTYLNFITFTEVSIFLMLCSLILFLFYNDKKSEQLVIIFVVAISFMIRKHGCLMLLPVFIPIALYKSYHSKEKFKQYVLLGINMALVLAVILIRKFYSR